MKQVVMIKKYWYVCLFFLLFLFQPITSYSLVGVEEVKQKSDKKSKNKIANDVNNKKKTTNSKGKDQKQSTQAKELKTGERPADVPEFPQDGVEEYKMLFDDGFSNVVEDEFQVGESFDIFVDREMSNNINRNYFAGNDDFITQMDVIEAEEKTTIDNNSMDKSIITTHRTRVMAYLTMEQMLYADMFGLQPHGYYVNAVQKK